MISVHRLILHIAVTLLGVAMPVSAQTLFVRPDTSPNYVKYRHLEECVATLDRLHTQWKDKEIGWRDTVRTDNVFDARAVLSYMIDTAKLCMRNPRPDTLPLRSAAFWIEAFLRVDMDAEAAVITRRFIDSSISLGGLRVGVQRAGGAYLQARPIRYKAVRELFHRALETFPVDSVPAIFFLKTWMIEVAVLVGDSTFARQLANDAITQLDTVDWSRFDDKEVRWMRPIFHRTLKWATWSAYLDSLAVSTTAVRAYEGSLRYRAYGDSMGGDDGLLVGRPAPVLSGDFWYHGKRDSVQIASSSTVLEASYRLSTPSVRPVPGRVNLLAFVGGGCHAVRLQGGGMPGRGFLQRFDGCWRMVSALRRLKQQFPELEITIVSSTFGSFGTIGPLEPAQEADTLAKFFLGFRRVPGTLVVSTTKYVRIPGLDQRRVDEDTDNDANYIGFVGRNNFTGSVFGVDENGLIFHVGKLHTWEWGRGGFLELDNEKELKQTLAAVYRRGG